MRVLWNGRPMCSGEFVAKNGVKQGGKWLLLALYCFASTLCSEKNTHSQILSYLNE